MFITPHLHNNLLIASFQIFGWLFFHPSAWRSYVKEIDSTLPPDFVFSNLSPETKNHPKLKRLRYIAFLILPLFVGLFIGTLLLIIHLIPWIFTQFSPPGFTIPNLNTPYDFPERFIPNIVLGVSYGMMLCFVGSTLSSLLISFPFAIIASVLSSLSVGILLGIGLPDAYDVWAIVFGIFALSVAGSVTAHWHQQNHQQNLSWQIGHFVIGTGLAIVSSIIVGIIILAILLVAGATIGEWVAQLLPAHFEKSEAKNYVQIIGMAIAVGLFLGGYLKKKWYVVLKWGFLFGTVATIIIASIFGIVSLMEAHTWQKRLLSGIVGGTVNAGAFAVLFAIPFLVAQRIASFRAGVIAGVLGSGGAYLGVMSIVTGDFIPWIPLGLIFFILGLTQKIWLPVLSYPFESASNLLIYRAQRRHVERTTELLQWHSAFWNEHQNLPLRGLEKFLVNVSEHDPKLAQEARLQLSNTSQNWAVQEAEIELNIRHLEQCSTIQEVGEVHNKLMVSDNLKDDVDKWLQSFLKNSQKINNIFQMNNYQQCAELKIVVKELEIMLKFANDQASVKIQRFQNVTKKCLHIIQAYVTELEEIQDIPNPYIVGIPLKENQDVFIPRPKANKRIERLLLDRSSPPLFLYGQRRMGKTSLLNNLFNHLPSNFVMLFIDCQGPLSSAQDNVSFFYNLGRAMIKSAKKHYPELTFPPFTKEIIASDPVTCFDEWLDEIEQILGDKVLLLALDEFITLDSAFIEGRLQRTIILGMFRNLIQHRSHLRFLFSGSHTFEELHHWANYLINIQIAHLTYLAEDEAHQLIEQPIEKFPLRYTQSATERVMALTNNQPALLQSLCAEIVQIKDEQQDIYKRLIVEKPDVEAAASLVLEHSKLLFAEIVEEQIDNSGNGILRFIASQGEGVVVNRDNLVPLCPTNLEKTLALLLQREIIEEREGGYCFQVELVRRWFLQ
ncbi:hypothetical protein [Candidatus Parabeggiatoa sp. HSG14]|uniref:hypothetical protein n=1 Tax=Candidatus Parabeggiatoa sp. HSG14 TaxID=3055593 RepID=UPI0025A7481E|nr:hypothetical protein [Thiotrichales bacterium HSG14]